MDGFSNSEDCRTRLEEGDDCSEVDNKCIPEECEEEEDSFEGHQELEGKSNFVDSIGDDEDSCKECGDTVADGITFVDGDGMEDEGSCIRCCDTVEDEITFEDGDDTEDEDSFEYRTEMDGEINDERCVGVEDENTGYTGVIDLEGAGEGISCLHPFPSQRHVTFPDGCFKVFMLSGQAHWNRLFVSAKQR